MPKIAVLTSYMHQRGGDLVGAISFMKAMLKQDPSVEFEWIIKRDISSHQKNLDDFLQNELKSLSHQVNLTVLNSADYDHVTITTEGNVLTLNTGKLLTPDELRLMSDNNWGLCPTWNGWCDVRRHLSITPLQESLSSVDAIAVVANPHRLVQADFQLLSKFKKPIVTIPEYDLNHSQNKTWGVTDAHQFKTGFHGLGVYIDETVTSDANFSQINGADKVFLSHLTRQRAGEYHTHSTLFYGYFFDNENLSHPEYTVKIQSYIQQTLMLAIDRNALLDVDIVIPGFSNPEALKKIYISAINSLSEEYRKKIKTASYDVKIKDDSFEVNQVLSVDNGPFNIRLINPGRLQRNTVQALLNEAEPFLGLTGDASWIEGLMKGKITCYQTVTWKTNCYEGFLIFLKKKFKEDSPLYQFYLLQKPSKTLSSEIRFNKMREIYALHKEAMITEAKALASYIQLELNLNHTLVPKFFKLISKPDPLILQMNETEKFLVNEISRMTSLLGKIKNQLFFNSSKTKNKLEKFNQYRERVRILINTCTQGEMKQAEAARAMEQLKTDIKSSAAIVRNPYSRNMTSSHTTASKNYRVFEKKYNSLLGDN